MRLPVHQPLCHHPDQQRLVHGTEQLRRARVERLVTREQPGQLGAALPLRPREEIPDLGHPVDLPEHLELRRPQWTMSGQRLDQLGPDRGEALRGTLPTGTCRERPAQFLTPLADRRVERLVEQRLGRAEVVTDRGQAGAGRGRDLARRRARVALLVQALLGAIEQPFAVSHATQRTRV